MDTEVYKGYSIWGHAIRQGHEFAASGTVTRNSKLIETSGVLGHFESDDEAQVVGLNWCRAWVDSHG